jgi:hypothetical protein
MRTGPEMEQWLFFNRVNLHCQGFSINKGKQLSFNVLAHAANSGIALRNRAGAHAEPAFDGIALELFVKHCFVQIGHIKLIFFNKGN